MTAPAYYELRSEFSFPYQSEDDIPHLRDALASNARRNLLIATTAKQLAGRGRVLVIVQRYEHAAALAGLICGLGVKAMSYKFDHAGCMPLPPADVYVTWLSTFSNLGDLRGTPSVLLGWSADVARHRLVEHVLGIRPSQIVNIVDANMPTLEWAAEQRRAAFEGGFTP